ncbi:MAG: trypsin-like serine protease [Steroidobacteraceae bacterium]|nr:trypsin-like serine protease [Steroidobacteraceae bacterium]
MSCPAWRVAHAAAQVSDSVVKIFATMRYPDPYKPWTKQAPVQETASGVVIGGDRILTNAHVVLYAGQIQVQAHESGDKIPAHVVAVAPGIDLAVLKVDDSFFKNHPPLAREAGLPHIKDAVLVYGFPTGGTSLSITKGIVSRIEFVPYNFPATGLRVQIDAAINPGNSGGPAVVNGRMIGIAFSRLAGTAENIGYIIPNAEIDLFLREIPGGHYTGKPAMYDELQTLENPALRAYLKLSAATHGVVVHRPHGSGPAYPLKKWDVITHIGKAPIDDEGMVRIRADLRVDFHYLVQKLAHDGRLPLQIVRGGKPMHIELPVQTHLPTLVGNLNGRYPSYFIYGPLVFSKATWQFLAFADKDNIARSLGLINSPLLSEALDVPSPQRRELVVVSSPFFPDALSMGYSNPAGEVVYSVDGIRVRSLDNLVAILRDAKGRFVTIEFEQRTGETLVFPRKAIVAATQKVLIDNDVRSQGSPDTMAVWRAKPSARGAGL